MKMNYENYGRYLEDFKVGSVYKHKLIKQITDEDNRLFCELTLNYHPLHSDENYAKKSFHGKIVVVGTYVASLAVGLSVEDISGKAIANLSYENINHHAPVFIGDTISAETEILSVRNSRTKPDRGIVKVETRAFNQDGVQVLSLQRTILIPKKRK